MTWDADAIKAMEVELGKRLERAAIYLQNTIRRKLNRSQPYSISKGKSYHGLEPSLPGEPPKKVRGDLQRSIAYEMSKDKQSAKIGTNLAYGKHLELGTRYMQPRPYLRSTLQEEQGKIDQILSGG